MKKNVVTIYTENVDSTVEFYKKSFGMEKRYTTIEIVDEKSNMVRTDYAEMLHENIEIVVCLHKYHPNSGLPIMKSNGVMFVLYSTDVGRDYANAVKNGANIIQKPSLKETGQMYAAILDPNGIQVRIVNEYHP